MDGVILEEIEINKNRVDYRFRCKGEVSKYFTTNSMYIEYNNIDLSDVPNSILAIPFVSSILPLMWLTNTVLWVKDIDQTFYNALYRIKEAYQNIYNYYPFKGNFVPSKITKNVYLPQRECLLLYSGGIDANTTYIRNIEKNPLLLNIQGWYKNPQEKNKAAESDFEFVKDFAKREQRDYALAKSNFAVLINDYVFNKKIKPRLKDSWWHGFQHSMSFISIAIVAAYIEKIQNVYIASSVPIGEYVPCASYITTDSEFKFAEVGGCVHDGSELTRQDKVRVIVNYAEKEKTEYPLKVCSFNDINCCKCDKCFRSILGIVAEGGDVRKYGFENIDGSLYQHFGNLMKNEIIKFNVSGEGSLHWPAIKKRMKENYDSIADKQFVEWFLNYDFVGEKLN